MAEPSAADRLKQALASLMASATRERLTVSVLCQLANVSRNSLYRYHPEVLQTLREQQRLRARTDQLPAGHSADRRHDELAGLRQHVTKLAALVDHYYAAYCEANALLGRRDQELAQLRRRLDSKPTRLGR
ncbi:MAG: hypothetical protein ACREU2_08245 [Steroidobacteraceae bacterium]